MFLFWIRDLFIYYSNSSYLNTLKVKANVKDIKG
jgi:hypothetical protein